MFNDMTPKKLRERFCKDCGIPIKITASPYFESRMKILDPFYDCNQKYKKFVADIAKYNDEKEFLDEYDSIRNQMIEYIKSTPGYSKFNSCDMNEYSVQKFSHKYSANCSKDIFKSRNVGRMFLGFDIKKANFTALKHFGEIFDEFDSYEDFVRNFTDVDHFIHSKYIREVVFGNCNPRRQITYERYLVEQFVDFLIENSKKIINDDEFDVLSRICFVSNDEVIIDMTEFDKVFSPSNVFDLVAEYKAKTGVDFKPEYFTLLMITGDFDGYIKDIYYPNNKIEFKCLEAFYIPLVVKKLLNSEISEEDLVFVQNGKLAKYLENPEFKITATSEPQ